MENIIQLIYKYLSEEVIAEVTKFAFQKEEQF